MEFNNPDKIIVYYYSQTNNIVYKPGDDEYQAICTMIHDAHKQTMLTSIFNGQLFKDVNIVEHNSQNIKYDGIKINFVYNMPQISKLKNKIYSSHIWYHNLIFEISAEDNFIYQSTAIISNKNNDVEMLSYQSHYLTYANYNCLYNYLKNIFN